MRQDRVKEILRHTNEGLQIFNFYMPIDFKVKKAFGNPLYDRVDTHKSCYIYYNKEKERYYFKDHGDSTYMGECFWFAGAINGMSCETQFMDIVCMINRDLCLGLDIKTNAILPSPRPRAFRQPQPAPVRNAEKNEQSYWYDIQHREMNADELAYWARYGISKEVLRQYDVVAVSSFSAIGRNGQYTIRQQQGKFTFAYLLGDYVKIYRPKEAVRFMYGGEKPRIYCFGLKQIPTSGDMVFITGGEYDALTLAAHSFSAVALNSETADIPKEVMSLLSDRFRHVIIMYDADSTGKEAMKKQVERWKDVPLLSIELPLSGEKQEKDISDFFAIGHKVEELKQLINEAIATTYEKSLLLIKATEMDFSNPPEESERVITANNVAIASVDNLICVSGSGGTGKSNFVSSLLSGALLSDEPINPIDTLGFKVKPNRLKKAVIHFDTEQSRPQLYKNTMMMLKRSGLPRLPKFFHSHYLTTSDRSDRLTIIRDSLSRYHQMDGGVYIVVIDGVADLIVSANDENSSVILVEQIYKLASSYHCCIICVLPHYQGNLTPRGHIGSELQRTSASILSVEKDENPQYSIVKAMKLRDGNPLEVPMQQITWDKDMDMFKFVGSKSESAMANRKKEQLDQIVKAIYKGGVGAYNYGDLTKCIEIEADVKERTAKDYIRELYKNKVLVKQGDKYVFNKTESDEP